MTKNNDILQLDVSLITESRPDEPNEGAFLVSDGLTEVWVPKSQCEFDPSDDTLQIPRWLAEKSGLI